MAFIYRGPGEEENPAGIDQRLQGRYIYRGSEMEEDPGSVRLPDESRSLPGDIAAGLTGGLVDLVEMGARISRHGQTPEEAPISTRIIEGTEKLQENYPFLRPSKEAQEGEIRRSIYEGTRMSIPSLGAALPGGIVGAVGNIPGIAAGAATTGALAFGVAEYDSFLDEVRDYENETGVKLDPELVKSKALKDAFVEGGFEGVSNVLDVFAAKVGGRAVEPLKAIVRKHLKTGAKEMTELTAKGTLVKPAKEVAKDLAGTTALAMPGEVGTEMAQSYFETKFRNDIGLNAGDPIEAAKDVIGPTAFMTFLFGVGATGFNYRQRKQYTQALADPKASEKDRVNAIKAVNAELVTYDKKHGTGYAQQWANDALNAVSAGTAINIDENVLRKYGPTPDKPDVKEPSDQSIRKGQFVENGDLPISEIPESETFAKPAADIPEIIPEGEEPPIMPEQTPEQAASEFSDEQLDEILSQETVPESGPFERVTKVNKPIGNGVLTDSKLFGNSSDAETLRSKGFKSIKRDGQHMILSQVRSALNNDQVFRTVVQSVPVDVMDGLMGKKGPSEDLLHDKSMLRDRLAVPSDKPIPKSVVAFIDSLASVVKGVSALPTTKESGLVFPGSVIKSESDSTIHTSIDNATPIGVGTGLGAEKPSLPNASALAPGERDATSGTNELIHNQQPTTNEPIKQPVTTLQRPSLKDVTKAAHEAATSPTNDIPEPTEGQIRAGNYRKGHIRIHGFDISIENPRGSTRSGVDKSGKAWETTQAHHYGYIRGTVGKDKDHLDVFIGPNLESPTAYVINQVDPETGKFDETKSLLGFNSREEAEKGYLDSYEKGWKGLGSMVEVPVEQFREWTKGTETKKPFPETKQPAGETKQGEFDPASMAVERYQWMRNKEGGQAHGNQEVIIPLNREVFDRYLKDKVGTQEYNEYAKEHPDLHVSLYSQDKGKTWKVGSADSIDNLRPNPANNQWAKKVDSFDSRDAKKQSAMADSEVISDKQETSPETPGNETDHATPQETPEKASDVEAAETAGDSSREVNPKPELTIEDYSEKSFVIRGNTKEHKDRIKKAGKGIFSFKLKGGPGWVFGKAQEAKVREALKDLLGESPSNQVGKSDKAPVKASVSAKQEIEKSEPVVVPEKSSIQDKADVHRRELERKGATRVGSTDYMIHLGDTGRHYYSKTEGGIRLEKGGAGFDVWSRDKAIDQAVKEISWDLQAEALKKKPAAQKEEPKHDIQAELDGMSDDDIYAMLGVEKPATTKPKPTGSTEKERLTYGRSGNAAFKKMADVAGLKDQFTNPDYNDFVSFFEEYYQAGVLGKSMPPITIHPDDAHAAYQAGRKDRGSAESKHSPTQQPATTKTIAKKAGVESVAAVKEGMKALGELFGGAGKLSSGLTFDEETYAKARPHFQKMWEHAKEAGYTLKELIDHIVAQFGDAVKPYVAKFMIEQKTGAKPEKALKPTGTPAAQIASLVRQELAAKRMIPSTLLYKWADEAYGGTQAEGKYTPKDAMDAMELGINQFIEDQLAIPFDGKVDDVKRYVNDLKTSILGRIPTQTVRTKEMEEFQQYSTPPSLAFVANWVANIEKGEVYVEPSAGVGGLAVFGKAAGAKVHVNELSPRRFALLKELGFDGYTSEDAELLNSILPRDIKPSVIVMNPPFSATAGRLSTNKTGYGAKHIEQALKRLQPRGRLVAIVGQGMADNAPAFRQWWSKIKAEYNVRANIGVSGDEYKKYGTTFDNQILVIDKTEPSSNIIVTGKVEKIEDLISLLSEVRNDRTYERAEGESGSAESGMHESPERPGRTPESNNPPLSSARGVGGRAEQGQQDEGSSGRAGIVESEPSHEGTDDGARGTRSDNLEQSNKPKKTSRTGVRGDGKRTAAKNPELQGGISKVEARKRDKSENLSDSIFTPYKPSVTLQGAKEHPGNLVESAAMSALDMAATEYTPQLPKKVILEGKISDAQLEAVIRAGQAHSEKLPSGDARRGFFIGDGTGVGKGREIASIIWDNWNQGRKKAVWISKNAPLVGDARRDIKGVGWDSDVLFDMQKIKLQNDVSTAEGVAFLTYDTLKTNKDGRKRLDQLVNWLGKDFDGVIAFDEAHSMGNAVSVRGKRGRTKPSARALAGVELQAMLPNARIVYVSATGATEVTNLAYASRLGLWGPRTAFPTVNHFVDAIKGSGIAAMEAVSRDLRSMGLYLARSLSYHDVGYERLDHSLTSDQREIYDELAGAWEIVLQNIDKALKVTGITGEGGRTLNGNAKGSAMAKFWGTNQRFWNQIITSMQMPSLITAVERDVKAGHSVVLQLVNTNEAAQNRAISRLEEEDSLEDLDMTPRQGLMEYVQNGFPVIQFQEFEDDNGNKRSEPVKDSNGDFVTNPEAEALRDELLDKLGAIRVPDGPLEIILDHFGIDKVAEVTGRTQRVIKDPKTGKTVLERRSSSKASADADAFNADKKQILVFSDAGGTGRSYHAGLEYKNQRKRCHYLVQPGWRADNAVQGFGRTHRSNQKQAPVYTLVCTDLKGHKRFISSIARRLDQLGALTKGQRETGSQGFFQARDNLESNEANDALKQLIHDIYHNMVPEITMAEFMRQTGLMKLIDEETGALNVSELPETPQFLNRLLNMKIDMQEKVFNAFSEKMDSVIASAIANGTLDMGIETVKAKRVKLLREEVVHTDEKTRAETKYVELELTHDARLLDFDRSKQYAKNGYARNITSGRIWAIGERKTRTNTETGSVVWTYGSVGANYNRHNIDETALDDPEKYERLSAEEARSLWEKDYSEMPQEITERKHLITGTLLPVWDRLPEHSLKINRVLVDGRVMIGRLIDQADIARTLNRLGASASKVNMAPEEIYANILYHGYKVTLANNWSITRRRVRGDQRIEVVGPNYSSMNELERYGVFGERINYITRFFVPTEEDRGVQAIKEIIETRPVVSAEPPVTAKAGNEALAEHLENGETRFRKKKRNDPFEAFSEEIEEKYKDIIGLAEALMDEPFTREDTADLYEKIVDYTIRPKELDAYLKGVPDADKPGAINDIKAAIANTIGDMIETYRYESVTEGQALEKRIDQLLAVTKRHELSGAGVQNIPGRSSKAQTKKGSVSAPGRITPKQETLFRRSSQRSEERRLEIISAIDPIISRWKNHPDITVTNSVHDLPEGLKRQAITAGTITGAFYNDTVYLVAEGLDSIDEAYRTILHETIAHWGLRETFGPGFDSFLARAYADIDKERLQETAERYGFDLSKKEDQLACMEEYIASLAEQDTRPPVWKRFIAWVRTWLMNMGFKIKTSQNDVDMLIASALGKARAYVQDGKGYAVEEYSADGMPMLRTLESIQRANRTSRGYGAVGSKAITPRYVESIASRSDKILDFGAGKGAVHAMGLRDKGFNVTAYDFGSNVKDNIHDPDALDKEYDIVYASNVLNVQSGTEDLFETLEEISSAVRTGGRAVFNFPMKPRFLDMDAIGLAESIRKVFGNAPKRVGGTKAAPLFEVVKNGRPLFREKALEPGTIEIEFSKEIGEIDKQAVLQNRLKLREALRGIKPEEIRAIRNRRPSEYRAILKSIVRHLFPKGADIQFRKDGNILDYDHLLSDRIRQNYIHSLPSTLKREHIKVRFRNGDVEKAYLIKKYFDPDIQKDIWDLIVQDDAEIRTKIARLGRKGEGYIESVIGRAGNEVSRSATVNEDIEDTPPSSTDTDHIIGSSEENVNPPDGEKTRFRISKTSITSNLDSTSLFPEVQKRMEKSRGLGKQGSVKERALARLEEVWHSWRRHFPHLDPAKHGKYINILRLFEAVPTYSKTRARDIIKDILGDLNNQEYDVFSYNVILEDMLKDIESGLLDVDNLMEGETLPFGYRNTEQVEQDLEHFKDQAAKSAAVTEALARRDQYVQRLRGDLVHHGLLDKSKLDDPAYFHHQVLEMWGLRKWSGSGVGSKDVRTHRKGWQIARKGSLKDYNTEYIESEFEVIAQGIAQIETKKTMDRIDREANIIRSLRSRARVWNERRAMQIFDEAGLITPSGTPFTPHEKRIAMGFKRLEKMADNGELEWNEEFDDVINNLEEGVTNPKVFSYLAWLLKNDAPGAMEAAMIFKGIKGKEALIKSTLGDQFRTFRDLIPEGYTEWKPEPGSAWYLTNSITDKVLDQIRSGEKSFDDQETRKILARGVDAVWVVPEEVAATLSDFRAYKDEGPLAKASQFLITTWKQWVLINPYRIIKYNLNNMSGDLDICWAYDPKIVKEYMWQAGKDLLKYVRNKEISHALKEEIATAIRKDVIGSGMTVHDITDITDHMALDGYLDVMMGRKVNAISRFWNTSKKYTTYRENILRLASYRYFKDRIAKGENVYGASNRDIVDSIRNNDDRAALLARELVGDYGNLTVAGQWLRTKMIPFYSWMEINAPRYVRMFYNLPIEGEGRGAIAEAITMKTARKAVGLTAKAFTLYSLIMLWNLTMFPDYEEELSEYERRQIHLILGRREDGTIITVRMQGALSDALSWFGLEGFPKDLADLSSGKKTGTEQAKEMLAATPNRIVNASHPFIKMAAEELTGYSTFPDIFHPRPIRDKIEHLARMFSLNSPYRHFAGKPTRGDWSKGDFWDDVINLVGYQTDPGEAAYFDTRGVARKFMERKGVNPGYFHADSNSKSAALYNYKKALQYGDLDTAKKYLDKYMSLGGSRKGLKISVRLASPEAWVPKNYRAEFRQSLSKSELEKYNTAMQWYRDVYGGQ